MALLKKIVIITISSFFFNVCILFANDTIPASLHTKKNSQNEEIAKIQYLPNDSVQFTINPRFWKNTYLVLVTIGLLFLLYILYKIAKNQFKKRRNRKIEQIVASRTKSIHQQIDKLQQQTDTLKEQHFEAKSLNKELLTESQLLKETNEMILEQNKKIEEQSKRILEKNNLLTQSLNYARRIQHSLFPDLEEIKKQLPQTGIFFQPKEIVSGDFYWMRAIDDKVIIAEVDCTGHGVPGAFMSMIGNTLLNEIILDKKIVAPDEIFLKLNESLLFIFSHDDFDDEAQDEGMDLTIAVIDKTNNKVKIASAMQNFYLIKNEEVTIIRGDIFSLGGLISRLKRPVYNVHEFDIEKGMRLIMSSDGFIDQFGQSENDKYGVERFYKLLVETSNLSIEDQITSIKKSFELWKGNLDQMDDVLILGTEF